MNAPTDLPAPDGGDAVGKPAREGIRRRVRRVRDIALSCIRRSSAVGRAAPEGRSADNGVKQDAIGPPRADVRDDASGFSGARERHLVSARGNSGSVNFWDALDAKQRHHFSSLARRQTFAPGALLMKQGEQANHVAVIIVGRVQISVGDDGHDLILAERGRGELVGERAALQVNVRSATVKALDKVQALVVSTADFAAFVSDHLAVLQIVENQIYGRLTEAPIGRERGLAPRLSGQNCTIVYTDVVGFAAVSRRDFDRLVVRRASTDMTKAALAPFWNACSVGDRGDGLLIVVPPDIPTLTVLEPLLTVLPGELTKHNNSHGEPVRVQLRVAVDVGPIVADTMGVSGEAIIHAARMLEAPEFKQAMTDAGTSLGMIVSGFVYDIAIKHGTNPLDPAGFAEVQVKVKESEMPAWMYFVNPAEPLPGGMSRVTWLAALRRSPLLGHLLAG